MRFGRKKKDDAEAAANAAQAEDAVEETVPGPVDFEDLPEGDDVERVDLGSLLLRPSGGRELRLQVEESTGTIQSVVLASADGALELRAFAAPRHGDLWAEVRPQIAADLAQRGGTATEREGPFGTELECRQQIKRPEGNRVQPSRIIGINGPRWMLRATLLGKPAVEMDDAGEWEALLDEVVVRRGGDPKPVGEALPLVLPPEARRVDQE